MKKIVLVMLSVVFMWCMGINVYAGELNENEKYIIENLSKSEYSAKIEKKYVNQLENYFCMDEVEINKSDADDFLIYLKEAINAKENSNKKKDFSNMSETYIYFEKAGTAIGLLLEYDSSVNNFYFIDSAGYIVLDFQDVIKNTGDTEEKAWNISIEWIFAFVVLLCVLGILANLRRWNKKMKRRNDKRYALEDEDEDELEIANRKTRKARLQTFTYNNIKQVLRYSYIPIIMGVIVIVITRISLSYFDDLMDSVQRNFINTQPLYYSDENAYKAANVKINSQPESIHLSDLNYPRYGEQYGELKCDSLGIDTPVFFGDRGANLKSGAGTYSGSGIPGQGKTILIGAHDTTFFQGLEDVKKGQTFTFTTSYGIYEYKVRDTKIYHADAYDEAYDLNVEQEQLILYTCYPFGKLNGEKSDRMFVYLDKVKGPEIIY